MQHSELFAAVEAVRECLVIGGPCVGAVRVLLDQCQRVVDEDAAETKRISDELIASIFRLREAPSRAG